MRVVEIGTREFSPSNKSEQTTPPNNKNQSSQSGSSFSPNNTSPSLSSDTSPATNNKTTPTNRSNSSSNNNNSPCNYSAYLGLPVPSPSAAIYDILTPNQVSEDPYIISIYQKIKPYLPSNVTNLSIKDVRKSTFVNGTLSY